MNRSQLALDPIRPTTGPQASQVGTFSIPSSPNSLQGKSLTLVVTELYNSLQRLQEQLTSLFNLLLQPYRTFIDSSLPPFVTAWIAVTYSNSWVDFGSPYSPVAYRQVNADIELRGVAKSGTATDGTTIFTLPPHLRPLNTILLVVPSGTTATTYATVCTLKIATDGTVKLYGAGGNGYISFDGVFFSIT